MNDFKRVLLKKFGLPVAGFIVLSLVAYFWYGKTGGQPATAEGFAKIEEEIKSKFGEEAYFTDIKVMYFESVGNLVDITVAEDPESMAMEEWNQTEGAWTQKSDITLEVPAGTNAADFMYQLGDQISLSKLGGLIEKSKTHLESEKKLVNPKFEMASIQFPDNGQIEKTEYMIKLKPENGGTDFNFFYNLAGELREMDY